MVPSELLSPDEVSPTDAQGIDGRSAFFIICDHAGRLIPRSLGALGEATRQSGHNRFEVEWRSRGECLAIAISLALALSFVQSRTNPSTDLPLFLCPAHRLPFHQEVAESFDPFV